LAVVTEETMGAAVKQKLTGLLYPDEIAVAAAAFQAALVSLGDSAQAGSHSLRRSLAEYISTHALNGELDVDRLRDGALHFVMRACPRPEPEQGPWTSADVPSASPR
jgi:hypothetical protein